MARTKNNAKKSSKGKRGKGKKSKGRGRRKNAPAKGGVKAERKKAR